MEHRSREQTIRPHAVLVSRKYYIMASTNWNIFLGFYRNNHLYGSKVNILKYTKKDTI